jgi:hypothetical protein
VAGYAGLEQPKQWDTVRPAHGAAIVGIVKDESGGSVVGIVQKYIGDDTPERLSASIRRM